MNKRIKESILFGLAGLIGILTFSTSVNAATTHLSGNYTGGKGGYISFSKDMKAGDTIRVVTGAGAGTGKISNGGGYSAIYINGTLAGVAGGAGYKGGTTGHYHAHVGSTSTQGDCYNTPIYHSHSGSSSSGGGCYTVVIQPHAHSGNYYTSGACYTKCNGTLGESHFNGTDSEGQESDRKLFNI